VVVFYAAKAGSLHSVARFTSGTAAPSLSSKSKRVTPRRETRSGVVCTPIDTRTSDSTFEKAFANSDADGLAALYFENAVLLR
jgi:hypothetical protein